MHLSLCEVKTSLLPEAGDATSCRGYINNAPGCHKPRWYSTERTQREALLISSTSICLPVNPNGTDPQRIPAIAYYLTFLRLRTYSFRLFNRSFLYVSARLGTNPSCTLFYAQFRRYPLFFLKSSRKLATRI